MTTRSGPHRGDAESERHRQRSAAVTRVVAAWHAAPAVEHARRGGRGPSPVTDVTTRLGLAMRGGGTSLADEISNRGSLFSPGRCAGTRGFNKVAFKCGYPATWSGRGRRGAANVRTSP